MRTLTTLLVAIAISLTAQTTFAAPNPPPNPPVANNDTATTSVNTAVTIPVLLNDLAVGGNTIDSRSVKVGTKPSNGSATVLPSGEIRYTPKAGFVSPPTDSFTYTVKGKNGATSNVATVTVTVQPANVPPVADDDSASTSVNTPVLINVVANDTDANGNLAPATVAIVTPPTNGTAVPNGSGGVTYTPNSGFFGTDTFTYNVKDTQNATSNTATVTVGVNAAPTANAGSDANAVTGQPVTLDGSGSSDPNNDTITFSWRFLSVPITSALTDADIVNPTTPAPSFTPDVDGAYELELTVTDPGGLSDTDTVIITAATPNVAPNANAGLDQNAEVNTLVTLNGTASSDPDNGPNPLTFQWAFASVPLGSLLTNADITNPTSPVASFTPDVMGVYTLTLTVSDSDLSDSDDVDINVTQTNVPPNADAGADVLVQLGEVATLNGTASSDPDNFPAPLTFQWSFVSVAAGSTLTNANITNATTPTASFTPDQPGFYTLQLLVSDGADSDTDEVMVKANAAPVAVDDGGVAYTTDEDGGAFTTAPSVLTNDTDANNDALTAVLDTGPTNASAFTLNPDGTFSYTPNADFSGDDTFTYHANDDGANGGNGADSNVATVTITVNEVNDAPVAVNDGGAPYTTNEDGGAFTTAPSVLTNDTDPENDPLTAVLNTGPSNASAFTLNPDGTFSYTPNADFFSDDTFTYHATDGNTPNPDSNVATVTITVNAVNDAPSFTASNPPTVLEDAGGQMVVGFATFSPGPANESGQTVLAYTVSNVSNPALFSGSPTVAANGTLTYTPAANANGSSTFDVVVQDSGGVANGGVDTSSPAQNFTITVTPVNDAPVAAPKTFTAQANMKIVGLTGFLTGVVDADTGTGSPACTPTPFTLATVSATSPPGGTVTITSASTGTVDFDPPPGVTGTNAVTFTYTVSDNGCPGSATSLPATATVTVNGPVIWFVNSALVGPGDGRLSNPFKFLSGNAGATNDADDVDAANHNIFLFSSGTAYTGGLTLNSGEKLIGQGATGTTFDAFFGISPPTGTIARPTINGTRPTVGGTVTVATNSTVRGLNIASTTATGLTGGAVTGVSVSEASVNSTTGTAVNLVGTGGTVVLTAVTSNGSGPNGIVLNGTSGPFTVLSTGAAGTGGQIANKNTGISLTNASNVTLNRMQLNDFTDFAIRGSSVVNFTMDNTVINGTNGNDAGADEGSVRFTELTGSAAISNSSISGTVENNFTVINTAGLLDRITFTNVNFGAMSAATGDIALLIESQGSAVINSTVQNSTFTAARGTHISRVLNSSTASDTVITGNTITNTGVIPVSGGGAAIRVVGGSNVGGLNPSATFNIANNTMRDSLGTALAVNKLGGSGTFNGTISGNTVGVALVADSGSSQGSGIFVLTDGTGSYTASITGNTVRQYGNFGIFFTTGGSGVVGSGTMKVTATGNTVSNPGTLVFAKNGIQLNGGATAGDTYPICLTLGGAGALANAITGTGTNGGDDFRLRQRQSTTVYLPGYGGTPNDNGAVVTFVQGNNDPVTVPTGSATNTAPPPAGSPGGGFLGTACPF